jgi:hypothetical protein
VRQLGAVRTKRSTLFADFAAGYEFAGQYPKIIVLDVDDNFDVYADFKKTKACSGHPGILLYHQWNWITPTKSASAPEERHSAAFHESSKFGIKDKIDIKDRMRLVS